VQEWYNLPGPSAVFFNMTLSATQNYFLIYCNPTALASDDRNENPKVPLLFLCLNNIKYKLIFINIRIHCRCIIHSPSIVRVIKARRMRWAGHVARMGEVRGATTFWLGGLKGGDH
jgi:hypothetical protein